MLWRTMKANENQTNENPWPISSMNLFFSALLLISVEIAEEDGGGSRRFEVSDGRTLSSSPNALVVPSEEYHQSEYVSYHDRRREFVSGFTGPERQTLMRGDQELEDDSTIAFYGLHNWDGAPAPVPITMIAAPDENENLLQPFAIMLSNYSLQVSEATTVAELKTLITENKTFKAADSLLSFSFNMFCFPLSFIYLNKTLHFNY